MEEYRQPQAPAGTVMMTQIGLLLLGGGAGMLLYYLSCLLLGWDAQLMLNANSPEPDRWQWRWQLGLSHIFTFLVSGGMTVWIFYRGITQHRHRWLDYLQAQARPPLQHLLLGVLLLLASMPLVLLTYQLNQAIPLPEIFKMAEDQTEEVLKGVLQMPSVGEFLANLILIAVLPALGEELVFRGVIQQQLMRLTTNPWVAILLAALIFSAVHFQFEGFIPRTLMGFLLGWVYWRTGNFWVPAAGHFFVNGLQVFAQYLYPEKMSAIDLGKDMQIPWEFGLMSLFLTLALMRLIWQSKREIISSP